MFVFIAIANILISRLSYIDFQHKQKKDCNIYFWKLVVNLLFQLKTLFIYFTLFTMLEV